jgi:5'-nucleotidase
VLGVGIDLHNLVNKLYTKGIVYNHPVDCANAMASILKNDERCDYVICLSHLGYKYDDNKISDLALAQQTKNIDLIIGGHTHTFLSEPVKLKNTEGAEVLITQAGWAGIWLGKADIYFSVYNEKISQNNTHHTISGAK